jgi:hypothetical protein
LILTSLHSYQSNDRSGRFSDEASSSGGGSGKGGRGEEEVATIRGGRYLEVSRLALQQGEEEGGGDAGVQLEPLVRQDTFSSLRSICKIRPVGASKVCADWGGKFEYSMEIEWPVVALRVRVRVRVCVGGSCRDRGVIPPNPPPPFPLRFSHHTTGLPSGRLRLWSPLAAGAGALRRGQ